jgi:hypothetical protein
VEAPSWVTEFGYIVSYAHLTDADVGYFQALCKIGLGERAADP